MYKEFAELIGVEAMIKIFEYYRGSQLLLPAHLYDRIAVRTQILKQYDGQNEAKLVRKYGYSQRWVAEVIKNESK
ncbi:Mor transcription activator family protein [Lactiplantibacillus plantarum]